MNPFWEGFFSVFKPKPLLTVSGWAATYRTLPRSGSSESGPWRNERTPYLVEIMDTLSASSRAKEVVFCKGSQIGATEAGLNWLMYLVDCVPGPILAFQPTEKNAIVWSKQRVGPSLEKCDRIKGKFAPAKSRSAGNTLMEKEFDGGYLFLRGTNTPNALDSLPIGNLYFDEVDRYLLDMKGEGDPIDIAMRRIATYSRAKAFFTSTPTLKATSRIWDLYQKSDRRVYMVPCPVCGFHQEIAFERLEWIKGDYDTVRLLCAQCSHPIEEYHKTEMLKNGKWVATNPEHWRVGFHLSSLYSPLGWLSWGTIARTFDEAEGNVTKMITFTNTILGLPWEEDTETIAAEYLARRVERYAAEVPDGVLRITMAVDVQNDRLECEIVGWGEGEESWGIRYEVIRGDLAFLAHAKREGEAAPDPTAWQMLDDLRDTKFKRADGATIPIFCTVIDSGGTYTDIVYEYVARRAAQGARVYAVKGASQPRRPLITKHTRVGQYRAVLFMLGVDVGKETVFSRLKIEQPGPGYCHFPKDENTGYNGQYYAGLISEKRVIKVVNGRKVLKWKLPSGARNEPFDLRVYNTAAIRIHRPNWDKLAALTNSPPSTPPSRPASPVTPPKKTVYREQEQPEIVLVKV